MNLKDMRKFEKNHPQLFRCSLDQDALTLPPTELTKKNSPDVSHFSNKDSVEVSDTPLMGRQLP